MYVDNDFSGGVFSSANPVNFFFHHDTFLYLKNNSFLQDIKWTLPGLFEKNPINTVNGSLWTLPYEVACYAWLFVFWGLKLFDGAKRAAVVCLAIVFSSFFSPTLLPPFNSLQTAWMLPGCFFLGIFFASFKEKIDIDFRTGVVLWILVYLARTTALLPLTFYLALFYTSLYLSTRNSIVSYFKLPVDLSYGVYLYGYFVQQIVKQVWPEHGPIWNIFLSLPITLFIAYLSFIFVERPMMRVATKITSLYRKRRSFEWDRLRSGHFFGVTTATNLTGRFKTVLFRSSGPAGE